MIHKKSDLPLQNHPPNKELMREAIHGFLAAVGFDPKHSQLEQTPQRVADCWSSQLLDGYQLNPETILSGHYPAHNDDIVMVHNIDCHGMCPHHLLPFSGYAHIAYIPDQSIVGFSRLAELVQCFTHRLTLQETATHQIAEALMAHLGAKGAACVITAKHMCMTLCRSDQRKSQVVTSSFQGTLREKTAIQHSLLYPPRT